MLTVVTFKRGFQSGLTTTWNLSKVIVPVYLIVTFLKYTPVMGKLLNIYAALGAISSLDLTGREITIIATMLLLSHSLPVESAVSGRTGVNAMLITGFRLVISVMSGLVLNLVL